MTTGYAPAPIPSAPQTYNNYPQPHQGVPQDQSGHQPSSMGSGSTQPFVPGQQPPQAPSTTTGQTVNQNYGQGMAPGSTGVSSPAPSFPNQPPPPALNTTANQQPAPAPNVMTGQTDNQNQGYNHGGYGQAPAAGSTGVASPAPPFPSVQPPPPVNTTTGQTGNQNQGYGQSGYSHAAVAGSARVGSSAPTFDSPSSPTLSRAGSLAAGAGHGHAPSSAISSAVGSPTLSASVPPRRGVPPQRSQNTRNQPGPAAGGFRGAGDNHNVVLALMFNVATVKASDIFPKTVPTRAETLVGAKQAITGRALVGRHNVAISNSSSPSSPSSGLQRFLTNTTFPLRNSART